MCRDAIVRACSWAFVLILLWSSCVDCCGPGRGGTRRRSTRKLMPLIFKEHVPNVYENTLGASGLTEGPITRDNPRFHELVPNYNPDIIFRDEEGTGADRLMTERCKERLDTLAISVMNLWPGVRLRVKEGWEEDLSLHSSHSLHYEGRAVDVATSDSDRSKYGMLARLAVEAGFDWVFYEARSHVHCSVKSESPALHRLGGCFPGNGLVMTPKGAAQVSSLNQGDLIQVMNTDGSTSFSPVLFMIHKSPETVAEFLLIRTSSGTNLRLTPSHLLLLVRNEDNPLSATDPEDPSTKVQAVFAGQVRERDYLLVRQVSGDVKLERIVGLRRVVEEGVYAPLTAEGNLLIDGAVVSCYAIIDSQSIAHWSFFPVRLYYRIKGSIWTILQALRIVSSPASNVVVENDNSLDSNTIDTSRILRHNQTDGSVASNKFSHSKVSLSARLYNQTNLNDSNVNIHWYPKMLYWIATKLLPKHLTVS